MPQHSAQFTASAVRLASGTCPLGRGRPGKTAPSARGSRSVRERLRSLAYVLPLLLVVSCKSEYEKGVEAFNEQNTDVALAHFVKVGSGDPSYGVAQEMIGEICYAKAEAAYYAQDASTALRMAKMVPSGTAKSLDAQALMLTVTELVKLGRMGSGSDNTDNTSQPVRKGSANREEMSEGEQGGGEVRAVAAGGEGAESSHGTNSGGHSASFDCAKASTPVEKAICADKELSELDGRMATLYKAVRDALPADQRETLRNTQRTWLGEARTGTDKASLRNAYIGRIVTLDAISRAARTPFSPFGEYCIEHAINVYDPETQKFTRRTASDTYTLARAGDKAIGFEIVILGHNARLCTLEGTATINSAGEYVWGASEEGSPCAIRLAVLNDRVRITPGGKIGCQDNCGMGVSFSEVELRLVERTK